MNIFVDDIMIMGTKELGHIKRVKAKLAAAFKIIDIGLISFYPGLKVERNR